MNCTLSFWWDVGTHQICYMIVDSNFGVLVAPHQAPIGTQQGADNEIQNLVGQILPTWNIRAEYKIMHSAPVAYVPRGQNYAPHPLSAHILHQFEQSFPNGRESQIRNIPNGNSLQKFKAGLVNLGLVRRRGDAWIEKLWMFSVHATNANSKKRLAKIWSARTTISTRTRAGKQQFETWYANL